MSRRVRRFLGLLATAALIGGSVPAASAHDGQHGALDGHLVGSGAFGSIGLVGKVAVHDAEPDLIADLTALGNYAYLARWGGASCAGPERGVRDGGAYVIDISDPASPREVGFIPTHQDTLVGEGMQALRLTTSRFSGDVLAMNHEGCGKNYKAGFSLWDISNPLKPKKLSEHLGDFTTDSGHNRPHRANQMHSVFVWDAGDRAYLVATDDEESRDVDIFDVTDPRKPVKINELSLDRIRPGGARIDQADLGLADTNLHDMVVKQIGGRFVMLLSYWDGGYVKLDVTDPLNPVYLGDTDYANPDPLLLERTGRALPPEGNGHQAEFTADNRFIIATDEDFSPYAARFRITSGPNAGFYPAGEFGWTVPIARLPERTLRGPTVFGGYGCPDDVASIPPRSLLGPLAPGDSAILVLSRGPVGDPSHSHAACFFSEKVEVAQNAGYDAVLIANHHVGAESGDNPDAAFCGGQGHVFTPTIPAVCVGHRAMHLLFSSAPRFDVPYAGGEPAIGTVGERIEVKTEFDGWGYVHLFDANTLQPLDAFAIPEAHDESKAFGFGDLSVHEVATDPDDPRLAYLSYYSGGVRALRIECPGAGTSGCQLVEIGGYLDPAGNDFWGVEVHRLPSGRKLILGSDRDSGLWIFERR